MDLNDDIDDITEVVHQPRASICMAMAFCSRQQSGNILFIFYGIFSLKHRQPVSGCMCKILLEGQMSGKKWEDALSFKCTLVGEYI
jgi:hypothetical protein